jgi:hypothetical protein
MESFHTGEYLVGEKVMRFTPNGIADALEQEESKMRSLSDKERALRFNGFIITDEKGSIVFEDRKRYSHHFFPLSVVDYAKALYGFERGVHKIPILSVDSHDVLGCDFECQDCLSAAGTNFPVHKFPKDNFNMDLETYKGILKSIADFSQRRGFVGVRFEQSGEGNPDFYKHRRQILEYARQLQMRSVYVSTGSRVNEDLRRALVENSSFIRISFPGIGKSYQHYSGQKIFSYDDALEGIRKIVDARERAGRERDLMIGARVALREEHGDDYFAFTNTLKNMGVDSLQIVKILVPEGRRPQDFPIPRKDKGDLERVATLDDSTFNVNIPHNLDYMVYSREIGDREEFPSQCFSAMFQPVLTGRSLFVCTISEIMYNHNLRLGTFENGEGELERFLSPENVGRVTKGIPAQCNCCSNIYDNMLLFSLQKLFRANQGELKFHEIIK